ncbi:MAG: hypothetical protein ACJAU6_002745 [Alphaproteobacteria bacterium]|jgi:hypothetical protein
MLHHNDRPNGDEDVPNVDLCLFSMLGIQIERLFPAGASVPVEEWRYSTDLATSAS